MNKKIIILVSLLFSTSVFANDDACSPTSDRGKLFPYAAQGHGSESKIEMKKGSSISGTNDGVLDFKKGDDLEKGMCDGGNCTLTNEYCGPSAILPDYQADEVNFTKDNFEEISTENELKCKSGSINNSNNEFKTLQVEGGCTVTLASSSTKFRIKQLKIKDGGKLTIPAGDYWINELDIEGGRLTIEGGEATFYIKEGDVDIKKAGSITGLHVHALKSIKVEDTHFTGNIFTNGSLKVRNNSTVKGSVRAEKLKVGDDDDDENKPSQVILISGDYRFKEVELKKHSILEASGSVTLYVYDELELEDYSRMGNSDSPITVFNYDKDDGVELKKGAVIYGFVYSDKEVELEDGAGIYGAVNTVKLEMDEDSFINYKEYISAGSVHHYKLDYNQITNKITVYACGDYFCSLNNLYQKGAKLHVENGIGNSSNIINFNNIKGTQTSKLNGNDINRDKNSCGQFVIQNADKNKNGAQPWPTSSPELRCIVDGKAVENCKFCEEDEPVNSYGYVYGIATIDSDSIVGSGASAFTVKQGGGNGLANARNQQPINNGSKLTLPLEFTFDKAEQVNLVLSDNNGREYSVKLTFVPNKLAWDNSSTECVGENGEFNYKSHHKSCAVLGKAGADTTLAISAYGEGGELIKNYQAEAGNLITINELNAQQKQPEESESKTFDSIKLENGKEEITYLISQVALIQAVIKEHCAPYAIDSQGKCGLPTKGGSQILGRTVPASLLVKEIENGKVDGGVVYAAQPDDIKFSTIPSFIIQGLDTNKKPLPSYTGQFAGGLLSNSNLELGNKLVELAKLSGSQPRLRHIEEEELETLGSHKLELVSASLNFLKDKPFSETSLDLPLVLTINDHDQTTGVTGETNLGSNDDKLRYGFLVLKNTELAVDQPGEMPSELHYYTKDASTTAVDKNNNYDLESLNLILGIKSTVASVDYNVPTVELAAKNLDVSAFSKAWRGEVTIEGDSDEFVWLKPYSKATGRLVYPKGQLVISDRKRGHDRVFNRREAVR